jgi:hypothetical protein
MTPDGYNGPLARRADRRPAIGREVTLLVDRRGTSGGPRELLWNVWIEEAHGSPPAVAELRYLSTHDTRPPKF